MLETASDFKGYIARYGISRSEGTLLRYLSDAYRVLDRTLPPDKRNDELDQIVEWLGFVVRTTDSSLLDEWAGLDSDDAGMDAAPPQDADVVVKDRKAVTLLVRNALFTRVRLFAAEKARELGELDEGWGWREPRWRQAMERFFDEHEEVLLDGDARSSRYLTIDEADERSEHVWHVRQMFHDADEDDDFGIAGDVDLDATQDTGEVVFKDLNVGFVEDLRG